jgi:hypothetical protein
MKIPVTCAGCGKNYEVDGAFVGKTGKCASCGELITIPGAEPAGAAPDTDPGVYPLGDPYEFAQSTFSASPATASSSRERGRDPGGIRKRVPKRSKTGGGRPAGSDQPASRRVILISLAGIIVVLALSAVFIPGARMVIGLVLASSGLLLCLYGYASGAYIAFTEDDLYGWLYLLFPFYTAYYFISRWDEMRSRLVMVVAGLALLVAGGRLLEADRAQAVSVDGAAAVPQ